MLRRFLVFALVAALGVSFAGRAAAQTPAPAPAQAPAGSASLDDIVAKNLEAKGGIARMKAVQSIKQTSKMSMQGMEATMTVFAKRPNLMRQEVQVGGQVVVNAFDGQTPWSVNPLRGAARPTAVTGPMADTIRDQSSFEGPLVDYKAKGIQVELIGSESLGDRKVWHLRLTTPSKQVNHLYLDAATGLDVKLTTEVDALTKVDQEFSDYRDLEGMKVPFVIKTLVNSVVQSEIRVQTVQLNLPMDDAMFRMPKG